MYWAVVVTAERYGEERRYLRDAFDLSGLPGPRPAPGDGVVLVAAGPPPVVFGLARVRRPERGDDTGAPLAYTRRLFDPPLPAGELAVPGPGVHTIDPDAYTAVAARAGAAPGHREWLVGLHMPIEAGTAAEAVRAFWSYARQLGPAQLPTFVSPVGDELAMRAYVLGEPANLDPEEDG